MPLPPDPPPLSPGWRPHRNHSPRPNPRLFSFPSCLSAFSFPPFLPSSPTQPNNKARSTRRLPSCPRFMDLFFELLLTAAATLLVAFLLAKLVAANNDPRHGPAVGPAVVIAEEKVEAEERIVEVDEAKAKGPRVDALAAAPTLSEGWVEVDKVPAAAVAEGKAAWVAVDEGVPPTLAPELFLGTVLEDRKEEGEVGKKQRDLTPEVVEVVAEAKPRDFGAETAAQREVIDVELEKETVQQHDLAAEEVAPSEVLDAELQKQQAQATEAVLVEQPHLLAEAAPAQFIDAGLEEEEPQADDEVISPESDSETLPDEVPDAALEKKVEEQVTEVNQHELASKVAAREIPDVVAGEEELKEQYVEEIVHQHEEVQNKEEAQCEVAAPVDQQEKLVPNEELVARKADDPKVSQEDSSNDKVVLHQLPEKEAALLGMPEGEAGANMEFEEWEGIERSEVEKRFGAAAAFAASDAGAAALSKLDSDVQLQLQGLLKVAIDGPCYDSTQPLTLRPSSRAKWVSWQKLGNMHPEIAMEKYMDLLSEFIPRWMGDKTSSTKEHEGDADPEGADLTMTTHTSDPQTNQRNEGRTSIDEGPLTSPPNPDKEQSSDVPAE